MQHARSAGSRFGGLEILQRIAALGLLIAIAAMSLLPAPWKGYFTIRGPMHNLEHVLVFCVLFLLASGREGDWRSLSWAALAVLTVGFLLEAIQARVYTIPLEYGDILDDGLGVMLGFAARFCYRVSFSA
jgi:hypothetical protein